jgi:hypothetical protein
VRIDTLRKERKKSLLDESSKQRVKELCDHIANEQDRNRFSQLVAELNQLLDAADSSAKHNRVFPPPATDTPS